MAGKGNGKGKGKRGKARRTARRARSSATRGPCGARTTRRIAKAKVDEKRKAPGKAAKVARAQRARARARRRAVATKATYCSSCGKWGHSADPAGRKQAKEALTPWRPRRQRLPSRRRRQRHRKAWAACRCARSSRNAPTRRSWALIPSGAHERVARLIASLLKSAPNPNEMYEDVYVHNRLRCGGVCSAEEQLPGIRDLPRTGQQLRGQVPSGERRPRARRGRQDARHPDGLWLGARHYLLGL